MTIIAPYTAPEFDKSALITIDVQRDVLEGQPLEVPAHRQPRMRSVDLPTAFARRDGRSFT
jgi:hypothetical protein